MRQVKGNAPELMEFLPPMENPDQTYHCFSSPEAMVAHIKSVPVHEHWSDNAFDAGDDSFRGTSFRGTSDMAAAYKLCETGWQEGTARVAKMRDRIVAHRPTQRRASVYGVAGAVPCIPRAIAGDPMHMKRIAPTAARTRPVLTLVNHMGGMGGIDASVFVNKCAAVAALVDVIEATGYACHVIGVSQSSNHYTPPYLCGVAVTVKESHESVDIGRMAFALGHVAMFRRFVFAVRTSDKDNRPLGSGMGRTTDFGPEVPHNTFVLPSMNKNEQHFVSEALAATAGLDSLIASLREQGCPAFQEA